MKINLKWNFDDIKIILKLCFDVKIHLKLCFEVKINLKLCFDDKLHLKLCFVRISCLIRRLTKRWNSRRIWKICYVFNFQLKKIRSKIIQITLIELWSFISFELRHLNSMKMSQKAKFGCSIFQLKIKRKQIFQVRHQFGHFVKCRIWHEKHKYVKNWSENCCFQFAVFLSNLKYF